MVIIYIDEELAMVNKQVISREVAECLVNQYRHPALGWTEHTTRNGLYIFTK